MRMPRVLELLEQHRPDLVCCRRRRATPDAFPRHGARGGGLPRRPPQRRAAGRASRCSRATGARSRTCAPDSRASRRATRRAGSRPTSTACARSASTSRTGGHRRARVRRQAALPRGDRRARARARRRRSPGADRAATSTSAATDLDVYDPAAFVGDTHVTDDERGALRGDPRRRARRRVPPPAPGRGRATRGGTTAPGNFHKGLGLRIDYLLATPDLAERVSAAGSRATTARARSRPTTRRSSRSSAPRRTASPFRTRPTRNRCDTTLWRAARCIR